MFSLEMVSVRDILPDPDWFEDPACSFDQKRSFNEPEKNLGVEN